MARLNAAEVILAHERRLASHTALIADGVAVSYAGLGAAVRRAASAYAALGLARGDVVGLMLHDSLLSVAALLGAAHAGLVFIPLNPRLPATDYGFIASDARLKLIVHEDEFAPLLASVAAASPTTRLMPGRGEHGFDTLLSGMQESLHAADTDAADPVFWLYSSGTTGRPKGIIHGHAGLAQSGKLLREVIGITPKQVDGSGGCTMLCTSKGFFAFGLDNGLLAPLSVGGTAILSSAWPTPEQVAELVERHEPDCLFSVPTFFRRLATLPADRLAPFRSVRWYYTGGERLPESLAQQWEDATGAPIHVCYGMSETYVNATANYPGRIRAGSIGQPLPGVETKLLTHEGGSPPGGEPGVLWLRHPVMALRYNHAEASARAFRDGWYCTNDLCTQDADGYLFHEGRADELLKVAGQWVKPGEVEEAALADESVREAACVIVPDAQGFERLALFIVAADAGAGDATAGVVSRCERLPTHSRPKWVRAVGELPKTATGKIQRFMLRERLQAELQEATAAGKPPG